MYDDWLTEEAVEIENSRWALKKGEDVIFVLMEKRTFCWTLVADIQWKLPTSCPSFCHFLLFVVNYDSCLDANV